MFPSSNHGSPLADTGTVSRCNIELRWTKSQWRPEGERGSPGGTGRGQSLQSHADRRRTPRCSLLPPATVVNGYALDETVLRQQLGLPEDAVLKKDATGRVLIPQPSDDPNDPLNWSVWKKRSILIMLAVASFTCDYSAATGASALLAQAEQWHISPNIVNHATAGNTFMLGAGGLFVVWLSAYFGRLPVLFWWTIIAAATAVWSAAAELNGSP